MSLIAAAQDDKSTKRSVLWRRFKCNNRRCRYYKRYYGRKYYSKLYEGAKAYGNYGYRVLNHIYRYVNRNYPYIHKKYRYYRDIKIKG